MRVKIEIAAKDLKKTSKGTQYTSLKLSDGTWINMSGDHRELRGSIDITEPKTYGNQPWAQLEKPSPSNETETPKGETKDEGLETKPGEPKTLNQWWTMVQLIHAKTKTLEPNNPEARAILITAGINAWLDGKIV